MAVKKTEKDADKNAKMRFVATENDTSVGKLNKKGKSALNAMSKRLGIK